jgi:hypothetical protein
LRPAKNVRIEFCPYNRCATHALDDPTCERNQEKYDKPMRRWLDITEDRGVYFYEYYSGMSTWNSLPYPTLTSLFAEWGPLSARGVKGALVQASSGHLGVYGINYVAFGRLGWDKPPTLNEYLKEYCSALYGEAAKPAEAIFRLWEKAMRGGKHVAPYSHLFAHRVFTPEVLARWEELLVQARCMAKTDKVRWRLDRLDVIRQYTALAVKVTVVAENFKEIGPKERAQGRRATKDLIRFCDKELKRHQDLLCLYTDQDLGKVWQGRMKQWFSGPDAKEKK